MTGTWRDPIPGWVETLHGPTGLLVGAGKGVIRSMHCRPEYNADVMPCDMAINAIIILAWRVASLRFVALSLSVTVSHCLCSICDTGISTGRSLAFQRARCCRYTVPRIMPIEGWFHLIVSGRVQKTSRTVSFTFLLKYHAQ